MMTKQNEQFDVEAVLRLVSEAAVTFEATLTPDEKTALKDRKTDDGAPEIVYSIDEREQAMADFDALAAADALGALADDIRLVVDRRLEEAYQKALEVYYVAEELARDPEHAELVPHVEAMRHAHEEQYGIPIPPKL